jgi:hypothetical protein
LPGRFGGTLHRHIDQHQSGRQVGRVGGKCLRRDPSPNRRGHDYRPGVELRENRTQILGIGREVIPAISRPLARAVTAQIEADHLTPRLDQALDHGRPHRTGLARTVDQQDHRIVFVACNLRLEPHATEALEGQNRHRI